MSNALVPIEQRQIAFYDDQIIVIQVEDGTVYVPIRPICTLLGIRWGSQYERIQRDLILSELSRGVLVTRTPDKGGSQEMLCLPLDMMHGWLFSIQASRVKAEVRPKLLQYQRDCYRVLADAFLHNQVTHRPNSAIDELLNSDDPLFDNYKMLMAMANMAREQITIKQDVTLLKSEQFNIDKRLQIVEADFGNTDRYITNSQAMQLSQAVKMIALELGKRSGGNEFQGVWGEIYRRYQISSYFKLPAVRFDEAMNFLRDWWQSLTDTTDVPF